MNRWAVGLKQFFVNRKLKRHAAELRRRLAHTSTDPANFITEPLLGCDALGQTVGLPLLSWLYFNPMGPTSCALFFTPVPGRAEGLISLHMDHPLGRERVAFGVVPKDVAATALPSVLVPLFAMNGHRSCRLLRSLPTSVFHGDNWDLSTMAPWINAGQARMLFRLAVQVLDEPDLKTTCEYLRRYKGDPWSRSTAEFDEGLLRSVVRVEEAADEFDADLYDEWFDLVTGPDHIRSERNNLKAAWRGAIENAARVR